MKKSLKRTLIVLAKWLGPRLSTPKSRRWFCDRVVPYLMDPEVLPRGLEARPTRRFGVDVLCDPYVYVHRDGYWCGVFFEEEVEAYMARAVSSGDTVIDVGMNVGHITIPAAALVGQRGRVISFDPNTDLVERVRALADAQRLTQIKFIPVGLGEVDGTFELRMEPDHAGGATFRSSVQSNDYSVSMTCQVKIGDEVLENEQLVGRVLLKMDVEGLELQALRGLTQTLSKVHHAIIEVSPEWLHADGVATLFKLFRDHGMQGFEMTPNGSVGKLLSPEAVLSQINVVFIRPARGNGLAAT